MSSGDIRTELAVAAARLIAEEGCEYAQAKRRAVQEIFGEGAERRTSMPDNSEVEHQLRRYLKLFGGESHRLLLRARRALAAEVMQTLREFDPYLIGAVLNGTATEHSDIHLELFVDSAKDVELQLMNLGIEFDVEAGGDARPSVLERLSFVVKPVVNATADSAVRPGFVGVQLHVYPRDAIRIARHRRNKPSETDLHPIEIAGRASLAALTKLMASA
ncbi:MAG: hypothetical protein ABJA83_08830 [Burkholderiaceae bacterium]